MKMALPFLAVNFMPCTLLTVVTSWVVPLMSSRTSSVLGMRPSLLAAATS
jgi:hypothetical protein